MCDHHPDRPAVVRFQGETDSFGSEMHDLCEECKAEWIEANNRRDTSGDCEWCGNFAEKRREHRDYEEGLAGRLYMVCTPCIDRQHKRLVEELAESDAEFDWG
jgi:hypothetical protein